MKSSLLKVLVILATIPMSNSYGQKDLTFNYQGRLNVQGSAFQGTAQFGFAILRKDGGETILWDSDGGAVDAPPAATVSLPVDQGVFNVPIGDTNLPNMESLKASLFQAESPLYLRVWVDADGHGLEQVTPDTLLTLTDLIGLHEKGGLTIYVDSDTGNDHFTGLFPARPKATIQGAIDALPPFLSGDIRISVGDGTYLGCNVLRNVQLVGPSASLSIEGNTGDPSAVRLEPDPTGCNEIGISVINNGETVYISGLTVSGFAAAGIDCNNSALDIRNCVLSSSPNGLALRSNSNVYVEETTVTNTTLDGIFASNNVSLSLLNPTITSTGRNGVLLQASSSLISDGGSFANCESSAIRIAGGSFARLRQHNFTNLTVTECGQVDGEASITVEKSSAMTISGITVSGTTGTAIKSTLNGMVDFDAVSSSISNMYRGLKAEYGGGILYKPASLSFGTTTIPTEATTNGYLVTN